MLVAASGTTPRSGAGSVSGVRPRRSLRGRFVVLVVAAATVATAPASPVFAAACPGADPCPYVSASVVGRRADGAFRFPQGIAVSRDGRVYAADQFGRDVQVFGADGAPRGVFGTQGAGAGQFVAGIGGLAIDPVSQDVFAIDSRANRIERFTAEGVFAAAFGTAGTAAGQFSFGGGTDSDDTAGGGVVVGGGKLYVADTLNSRVQRMNLDGTGAEVLSIPAPGGFSVPEGVGWTDADGGLLYVADNRNDRIVTARPAATEPRADVVAISDPAANGPDGKPALDQPYDVTLDGGTGRAYVASDLNSRLVKFGPAAGGGLPLEGVFGTFGTGLGQIQFPRSIAVGGGEVFLAEAGTNRVQVFGLDGASRRTFGFAARAGGDFTLPQGIAPDRHGDVLVADTFAYRGLDLRPDGSVRAVVGAARLFDTTRDPDAQVDRFLGLVDIAQAPDGTLVALDSRARRVVRFDAVGRLLGVVARAVVSSRSGAAEGGIAVGADGGIWVADAEGDVLKRLDPVSGVVTVTVGGAGAGPGQLNAPQGVRIAADGHLWVADGGNARVQELLPDGTHVRSIGTSGAVERQLEKPAALALDGRGRVYVADVAKSKVLVYATTDGAYVTRWGERGVVPGQLLHPRGVAVDCTGTVTVADTDANRLQRFVLSDPGPSTCVPRPSPPPSAPPVATGTTTAPPTAPVPPLPPSPAPPHPRDAPQPSRVSLRLVRSSGALGRRGVTLRLSCNVACVLRPSFTLSLATGRSRYPVAGPEPRRLAAGRAVTLAVHPRAAVIRALRRRAGSRRRLRLVVTVRAQRAGAATSLTRRTFKVRA